MKCHAVDMFNPSEMGGDHIEKWPTELASDNIIKNYDWRIPWLMQNQDLIDRRNWFLFVDRKMLSLPVCVHIKDMKLLLFLLELTSMSRLVLVFAAWHMRCMFCAKEAP